MSDIFMNKFIKKKKGAKPKTGLLRRLSLWLLAIVGSLGFSLSPMSSVFAASIYDNVVHPVSILTLTKIDGSDSEALTDPIISFMRDYCATEIYNAFESTIKDEDGNWAIAQINNAGIASVAVYWTTTPNASASFISVNGLTVPVEGQAILGFDSSDSRTCAGGIVNTNGILATGCSPSPCTPLFAPFLSTYPLTYPTGYDGEEVPAGLGDIDGDGLTLAQEITQGTSDGDPDTDGDALDDDIESIWNPDRDDIFCGTSCAYPNPLVWDLYVEIDWLSDGTTSYKPTYSQLASVKNKFAYLNILFHADTGLFGGGNELTVANFNNPLDVRDEFYSFKWGYNTSDPANFNENRYHIWHYMISGYNFDDGTLGSTTSSGKAEGGGDDTFISYGYLKDNQSGFGYANFDDAVTGTIIHELGHNLCLTNTSYFGQDSSCLFSGIDDYSASSNYQSAMNYHYQFTNNYSYSDGTHGTGDHNDINAIVIGIDDFLDDDDSSLGGPSV